MKRPVLLFIELSHLINGNYLKRASPRSTLSLARARRRRISITAGEESEANVTCGFTARLHNVLALDFVACQSKKRANTSKLCKYSICSPSSTILPSFFEPQASLPSAAQPAVMDIRRLRQRAGKRQSRARRRFPEMIIN